MDDAPSSPSTLSSCSSDAVNTSSARIHMGTRRPFEDKFEYLLSPVKPGPSATTELLSPKPTSPSIPHNYLMTMSSQSSERTGVTNDALPEEMELLTPDNETQEEMVEGLLDGDEPSSAIASRIIRAHDNPSPPPRVLRSSPTAQRSPVATGELEFEDLSVLEQISDPTSILQPPLVSEGALSLDQADSQRDSNEEQEPSLREPNHVEPERDLISFDHSIILAADHEASTSEGLASQYSQPTVDDLLFSSPAQTFQALGTPERHQAQPAPITNLLQTPNIDTPRRRSPRLSALPPPKSVEQFRQEEITSTISAMSTSAIASPSRKRRRDDGEKLIRLTPSPVKVAWSLDSDVSESDSQTPIKKERRERKRFKEDSDDVHPRLAGSLSPDSAQILSSLVLPVQVENRSNAEDRSNSEMSIKSLPANHDSIADTGFNQPQTSICSTESSKSGPKRPIVPSTPRSSASRTLSSSPMKYTLSIASDDPNRTPARRVPIFMPPGSSNISAMPRSLNLAGSSVSHTPVFSRPLLHNPDRSPARRVPMPGIALREQGKRDKVTLPRSALDPRQLEASGANFKPGTSSKLAMKDAPAPKPAPSTASILSPNSDLPPTGDSARGKGSTDNLPKAKSRIPRVGSIAKPTSSNRSSKLPMPSSKRVARTPHLVSPAKERKNGLTLQPHPSSGSEDSAHEVDVNQPVVKSALSGRSNSTAQKPNRVNEKGKTVPPQPLIKIRQVVPGMFGGSRPDKGITLAGVEKEQSNQVDITSPIKPVTQTRGPIKAREVVKGTLQNFELKTTSSKTLEALAESRAKAEAEVGTVDEAPAVQQEAPCPTIDAFTFSCAVSSQVDNQMEVQQNSSPRPTAAPEVIMSGNGEANDDSFQSTSDSGARRSSRTRRPVQHTDVFGSAPAGPSKPKRKPLNSSAPGDLFLRNNGLALRTLTNTNTTRNQQCQSQLEVMIIRKTGNRPESPTMKLRTIQEKQKEDQGKMRAERARRRRESDIGDSSFDSEMLDISMDFTQHRRGPGEDEVYETPVRPLGRKGVKWDRGLETTKYLDEIQVQPPRQQGSQAIPPRKSCLRISANVSTVDDLGNAATSATVELAQEKVVVTKFVYDNDEEAILEQPRSTRSKAKKGR